MKIVGQIYCSLILCALFFIFNVSSKCEEEGCQAYPCFDAKAQCGPTGYLIAFGEKYCRRFGEKETTDRFDEAGKKFLQCTTSCLIHEMQLYIDNTTEKVNCDNLTDNAFQTHTKCYLDCEFCNVCKTNKMALLNSYDVTDFLSLNAVKQVWNVINTCGFFACF